MLPDMTLTLDALEEVRSLYDLSWFQGYNPARLWRIEKYLVWRLERVGVAAPADPWQDADPADEYDYPRELIQAELGENGAG